jgi:hypothetical protein
VFFFFIFLKVSLCPVFRFFFLLSYIYFVATLFIYVCFLFVRKLFRVEVVLKAIFKLVSLNNFVIVLICNTYVIPGVCECDPLLLFSFDVIIRDVLLVFQLIIYVYDVLFFVPVI